MNPFLLLGCEAVHQQNTSYGKNHSVIYVPLPSEHKIIVPLKMDFLVVVEVLRFCSLTLYFSCRHVVLMVNMSVSVNLTSLFLCHRL